MSIRQTNKLIIKTKVAIGNYKNYASLLYYWQRQNKLRTLFVFHIYMQRIIRLANSLITILPYLLHLLNT